MNLKVCKGPCGETFDESRFYQTRHGRPMAFCKRCHNKRTKDYESAHPQQARARKKRYHELNATDLNEKSRIRARRLKREVIQKYGGVCLCCGESELSFLTIGHAQNDGAQDRLTRGTGSVFYNRIKKEGFPMDRGYQVECWNCNCGARIAGGICPHQEAA